MGDYDHSFSRAPSNDDFQVSTEKILVACLETGSLVATTQRLNISERCVVFVVKKHLEENQSFFESGCEELKLTATDFHSRLMDVWSGLFNDNVINWGRVLTMLCFCRVISIHSQRIRIPPSAVESIAPWAANFICTSQLKDWIISEGGWESFPKLPTTKKSPAQTRLPRQENQTGANGWVEQGFKGLAFSLQLLNALRVR